ncbi:MAG TPA: hypothetical protein VFR21_10480, partial [Bradyrhizobium sp.]|nr:hypothetical protein [Bradyrhizobium sp.]
VPLCSVACVTSYRQEQAHQRNQGELALTGKVKWNLEGSYGAGIVYDLCQQRQQFQGRPLSKRWDVA